VEYRLRFSAQAIADAERLSQAGLQTKAQEILLILMSNPYQTPPRFEQLRGDLRGLYSRRINLQHRIVYQVIEDVKEVRILRMWTHYQ
jgi:toxin YoeB